MSDKSVNWQPSANLDILRRRAQVLADIRHFFVSRGLLEVDTPCLMPATVTDVHLSAFTADFCSPISPHSQRLYLQTSPEYAMKRLLCAGSGSIFQICKAFRNEEAGKQHNPEFTMLEWYRVGWDHWQLMNEVDALLQQLLQCEPAEKISYQQCFIQYLGVDPLSADLNRLQTVARGHGFAELADGESDPDTLLQLLFTHCIEGNIGQHRPCLVTDFPASQSALARINSADPRVADRFELYFKGLELANGYFELTDAEQQLQRFEADNLARQQLGLATKPIDQTFLAAIQAGLPPCAGVALGIDRLIMLMLNKQRIAEVMAFPIEGGQDELSPNINPEAHG